MRSILHFLEKGERSHNLFLRVLDDDDAKSERLRTGGSSASPPDVPTSGHRCGLISHYTEGCVLSMLLKNAFSQRNMLFRSARCIFRTNREEYTIFAMENTFS